MAARNQRDATKQNRRSTRKQLDRINENYRLVSLRSGLSVDNKTKMRADFAQQVAQVRLRWNTKKAQIAKAYVQMVKRRQTGENLMTEVIWFEEQVYFSAIQELEKKHINNIRRL